jgi:hypothetical protein
MVASTSAMVGARPRSALTTVTPDDGWWGLLPVILDPEPLSCLPRSHGLPGGRPCFIAPFLLVAFVLL